MKLKINKLILTKLQLTLKSINHVDDLTFTYKVNDYEEANHEENDDSLELEINDSSIYKSHQVDELNLHIGGNEIIKIFLCLS